MNTRINLSQKPDPLQQKVHPLGEQHQHGVVDQPTAPEIESALGSYGGSFVVVADLRAYASKIASHAKFITRRGPSAELLAFLAFYDDQPDAFVTMVWTHPSLRGRGVAEEMLRELLRETPKDISLEVQALNPALRLYERMGFNIDGGIDACKKRLVFRRRIAVMQPYLFPHLGYFHLGRACSHFVFYDDVNFIKGGWINRNRLLGPQEPILFSVPLARASQNCSIRNTLLAPDTAWRDKLYRTIHQHYRSAPFFETVMELLRKVFDSESHSIADLAAISIIETFRYLRVPFSFSFSSTIAMESKGMPRAERLAAITKQLGCHRYVNSPGGRALYSKEEFMALGVELSFVDSTFRTYDQGRPSFVSGLSMIDVLMWNEPATIVSKHLRSYSVG